MRPLEHLLQRRQLSRAEGGAITTRLPRMPRRQIVGIIDMAAAAAAATADVDACNGRQL